MKTVAIADVKSQLDAVLQSVQSGETVVIVEQGREVAHVVPPPPQPKAVPAKPDVDKLIAEWRKTREGLRLGPEFTVRQSIEEGRR